MQCWTAGPKEQATAMSSPYLQRELPSRAVRSSPQRAHAQAVRQRAAPLPASWRDDLPRIIDGIPRRLLGGNGSLMNYGSEQAQQLVQFVLKQVCAVKLWRGY